MSSLSSRSKRILSLLENQVPKYESTQGTTTQERELAATPTMLHTIFASDTQVNRSISSNLHIQKRTDVAQKQLDGNSDDICDTNAQVESSLSPNIIIHENILLSGPNIGASCSALQSFTVTQVDGYLSPIPESIVQPSQEAVGMSTTTHNICENNVEVDHYLAPIIRTQKPILVSRKGLGFEEDMSDNESEPYSSDHSQYLPCSSSDQSDSDDASAFEIKKKKKKKRNQGNLTNYLKEFSTLPKTESSSYSKSTRTIESDSLVKDTNENTKINKKKRIWIKTKRLRNMCYFCESEVLNFARHLITNHKNEPEVQKILLLPAKHLQRNTLIADIRKRGNHLQNIDTCVKPVKKSHHTQEADYLPCKYCLGYYRPKQLWRHIKRTHNKNGGSVSHQSESQSVLVKHLPIDKQLRDTVFPRMRADRISLAAKKDLLICKFGSRYLKTHREKHLISVCSRKMRELSKLLLEVQKLNPSIKNLYDALRPEHFDLFVESTKTIAQYDPLKEVFGSPTYAMNIQTSLKQCCDVAVLFTIKRKQIECNVSTAERESNFRSFKQLLEDDWRFEISTIAATDLSTKKWNKVTILPLARDLKVFRSYLLADPNKPLDVLKSSKRILMHTSY